MSACPCVRIITCWVLTLCHMVSTSPHGRFQPNRGPVLETSNQKETIVSVSKSWALILSMADISQVPFLKSVYLSYSNKNTSLKFSRKNLSCYAVRHCSWPEFNSTQLNSTLRQHYKHVHKRKSHAHVTMCAHDYMTLCLT